ncbi:MAG TPA: hypothetical protein VI731_06850 [Bacteroidia bacterium]|nr:hypothetical protein [Bacteroidia bacterium]
MKTIVVLITSALLVISNCNKSDIAKGTPECVQKKIKEFDKSSSCNDARVKEYLFQGKHVFVFEPGTCGADMTSEVMDSGCSTLGYLGGISGNTKINGEEFSTAMYVKIVWEK